MSELRLVLAISLDGRLAPPQGGAAQLGGCGDRAVLEEALAWADAVLIGAQTLRLHGSTCLIHRPELLLQRRLAGQPPQPVAIAVSRSRALAPDLPFFAQPLERWLLTPALQAPATQAGFARVLPLAPWPQTLAQLAAAGLHHLVVLGGAELASSLLAAGCIDELQLTLCPLLLAGTHSWIPADAALPPHSADWQLCEQRLLAGQELLLRYRLNRSL